MRAYWGFGGCVGAEVQSVYGFGRMFVGFFWNVQTCASIFAFWVAGVGLCLTRMCIVVEGKVRVAPLATVPLRIKTLSVGSPMIGFWAPGFRG